MAEIIKIHYLIVSDTIPVPNEPNLIPDWSLFIWIDTANRVLKRYDCSEGEWIPATDFGITEEQLQAAIDALSSVYAAVNHSHSEFKDITVEGVAQFNNLIKLGDMEGQTAEIKTEGGVLVFKNGILIKVG